MTIQKGSIEVELRANLDQFREGMAEAQELSQETAEQISNNTSSVKKSFDGIGDKAQEEFGQFADAAFAAFDKASASAAELKETISSIGSSLKTIGFGALQTAAAGATMSLVKMAKAGVADTSSLEKTQIQMMGLTHSIESGNRAMAMAVQYYKNNPFNRFEVTDATKNLIQFGASLEEIPALLDKMGKVSLSTGASIDQLSYIYQRMISDGRINTLDLLQLQTQGVAIFDALGKRLGTTSAGVRELVAQGKVSIEDVKGAFEDLVDDNAMEAFNKTLDRQVGRAQGRLSDFRGALSGYFTDEINGITILEGSIYEKWTAFLKKFADLATSTGGSASPAGKAIVEGFQKISVAIGNVIDKLTTMIEPALNIFGKLLNFIGDNAETMIPIIGAALLAFTNVAKMLPGVGNVVTQVTNAFKGLNIDISALIKKHWLLVGVVALLGAGFMEAYKTDEEFRKTIQDLFSAISELGRTLMDIVKQILPALVQGFKTIASSDAVKGILQAVAGALSGIAKALASIPPEALTGIISFFVAMRMLRTNPIMLTAAAIGLLITYIQDLVKNGENLPKKLLDIGHNMMTGLLNGLIEGSKKVWNFVKDFGNTIVSTFKNIFKIHSPSQVMYGIGENIVLGLAHGVEDSKNVMQVAMYNLAKDILSLSNKVIKNKVDFGILDIKQEYKEWKKVSKLFTQGSEQYNQAIENMEDARKRANLQILELQRTYNDALDTTIDRIANMYGLFDEVNLGGGKNSNTILKNLDQQVAKMNEWAEAQKMIAELELDETLKAELAAMGVAEVNELAAIANMTASELAQLNDMWLMKQDLANKAGIAQMANFKDETLKEINDLKKGIDGETVDIADVGGRLVESISEGIYGAMPTLESAYAQLGDYIADAQRKLGVDATNAGGDNGNNDPLGTIKQEIEADLGSLGEKLKSFIPQALLGIVGAIAATGIAKKLFSMLADKLFGGGQIAQGFSGIFTKLTNKGSAGLGSLSRGNVADLADVIATSMFGESDEETLRQKVWSNIQDRIRGIDPNTGLEKAGETVAETAKKTKSTTQATQTIANNTTEISDSMAQTGAGFSKVNAVFESIKQGAQTVIWIAAALAAMALAIKVTYELLKEVDFGGLVVCLGEVAITIAAMGALTWAIDKIGIGVGGILAIIGLAVDIAAMAAAIWAAHKLLKDISWEEYWSALGQVEITVGIMGALAGVIGYFGLQVGVGAIAILGLALDIVAISAAVRDAYDKLKDIPWEGYWNALGQVEATIGIMGALSGVIGAFAIFVVAGVTAILYSTRAIVEMANAIKHVHDTVPDDFGNVNEKIKLVRDTIKYISDIDLGQLIGTIVMSWSIGPLIEIIDGYVHIAEQLNRIQDITLNEEAINTNLAGVKNAIEQVRAETGVISGRLQAWADEAQADSVESAGRILKVYGDIVDVLDKLADVKIDESVYTGVKNMTTMVQNVLGTVALIKTAWWVDYNSIDETVGLAKSIMEKFTEIIPTIREKIEGESIDEGKAIAVIAAVSRVVYNIGNVNQQEGMENKEKTVGLTQSILNKFTEIIPTVRQLIDEGFTESEKETALASVKTVRDLVYEIGEVNQQEGMENKEKVVGLTQSILNKFTELVPTIQQLVKQELDKAAAVGKIQAVRDLVYEIGQINQDGSDTLVDKEWIVGMATSIAWKLGEFVTALNSIGEVNEGAGSAAVTAMTTMFGNITSTLNESITGFDELGVNLVQHIIDGINSMAEATKEAGHSIQSSIWNGVAPYLADEYDQGVSLAENFANGVKSVDMTDVGHAMQSAIWNEIQARMNDEYDQGKTMGQNFHRGLSDVDYGNAGWWAVQGFIDGAWGKANGSDGVYNTGWQIADKFLKGLKDRGQQGSPWKTTMESGQWAAEGLIDGLQKSEKALVNEATTLADEVIDALSMDDLTMSPLLDARVSAMPVMASNATYGVTAGNGVVINQEVNAYTDVDMEKINRDLAWQLSTI